MHWTYWKLTQSLVLSKRLKNFILNNMDALEVDWGRVYMARLRMSQCFG